MRLESEREARVIKFLGGQQLQENKTTWKIAFLGLFLFHIPLPFKRGTYKCKVCAHSWTKKL